MSRKVPVILLMFIFLVNLVAFSEDVQNQQANQWFETIKTDKLEIVKTFVEEHSVDINMLNAHKTSALIISSNEVQSDIGNYLIKKKDSDLNERDEFGSTALIYAADKNHTNILKELIEADADVNAHDNRSKTSLILTSFQGSVEIVQLLVAKGASINIKSRNNWTALMAHETVRSQNLELVQYLIKQGANIYTQDAHGRTILDFVSDSNELEAYLEM